MSLIIFLIVLSILVVVHEWGHFVTAKALGVRVLKFSVGFGKKLFSWTHDGTEFMICAIPLGGYVKMSGEERSACQGKKEEFFCHPVGHRALIVLMGPVINIVFAYLCFYVLCVTGYPVIGPNMPPKVGQVMEGTPAAAAQLQIGDLIVAIDGKPIEKFTDLQEAVSKSAGQAMSFSIRRGEETMVKTIAPQQDVAEKEGGGTEQVWRIGVSPLMLERYGVIPSFWVAMTKIGEITTLTFKGLYSVITGEIPAKNALAGPIGIFDIIKNAAAMGMTYLTFITAVISLNLAIFNLFPIPVLDGGHLLFFGIERLRGRPLSLKLEEGLTKLGMSLLLCLFVLVLYNDIDRIGWVEWIKNFVTKMQSPG